MWLDYPPARRLVNPAPAAAAVSSRAGAARALTVRAPGRDTASMAGRSGRAATHDLNAYLARHVPITRAMGIRLRSFGADGVTMTAPLKPNINDKGIAFGGTLASILALSGWAFTDLALRAAGEAADVLIAVATIEYLAPVAGRIVARCPPPPAGELEAFLAAYRRRGRARLNLGAYIETGQGKAAVFSATYLARPVGRRGSSRPPRGGGGAG